MTAREFLSGAQGQLQETWMTAGGQALGTSEGQQVRGPKEGRAGHLRDSGNPVSRLRGAGPGAVVGRSGVSGGRPGLAFEPSVGGNHWWLGMGR